MKKLKVGILSLTCCEGCQISILDLGEKLFAELKDIDIVEMNLIEETREAPHFDAAFVEGAPITRENREKLIETRKKTDFLVALGACATTGCIMDLKNYQDKKKAIKYVYQNTAKINNPNVVPIHRVVKVDYRLETCPVNNQEFLDVLNCLKAGRKPESRVFPVCWECQIQGALCLLYKGQPCIGPISRGGCGAICTVNKKNCYGCRGPLPRINFDNFRRKILNLTSEKYFEEILKVFGVEDDMKKEGEHGFKIRGRK